MTAPPHVVLLAPCCDGTDTGEAWSTFQWVRHLSARCRVTVLSYRKRDRPSVVEQLPGVEVVEWNDLPLVGRARRFNAMAKPGYAAFYLRARRWLRRAPSRRRRIDLIHQLAPLAPRYPSPAAGLGVPWVLGPVGGGLVAPSAFASDLARDMPWFERLRGLDALRLAHDPILRHTLTDAAAVVGVAPYVGQLLGAVPLQRFVVESETGVLDPAAASTRSGRQGPLQLLFVGRVLARKGCRYLVRAVARLPNPRDVRLDVLGSGTDLEHCRGLVRELGLHEVVRFHGQVPRAQVDEAYRRADVFVFPSLIEPSGNVVFEALAHGLPVVTCASGGPGHVVDGSCGVALPPTTPDALVQALAGALSGLLSDPIGRERLAVGACRRVRELADWGLKADRMLSLYEKVLSGTRRSGCGEGRTAARTVVAAHVE